VKRGKKLTEILKPCPFCGKKPYLFECKDGFGKTVFEIGCKNRRCKFSVYSKELGKDKKTIIAAWNKRVNNA
jgi:Lar family restriction alleviation protein